ncbi:MAG TPA: hypothetical protein VFB07_06340 [Vicinamibacterales bacterium]|nr:hypothetical protein [Vicinamibacterales bacterium]
MHRFLRAFAGVWLACQLVAVVSPLTLVGDSFGIDQASCCPGIGPGQICPMHHKNPADRTCQMESACAHHDAALLTIVATGALPVVPSPVATLPAAAAADGAAVSTLSRAVRPDAPPPRA